RADRGVHLAADAVALGDELGLAQRRLFFDLRLLRRGRAGAAATAAPTGKQGDESQRREGKDEKLGPHQGIDASSGAGLLRPRDSNPDYLVQSEACCHYTRAQRDK